MPRSSDDRAADTDFIPPVPAAPRAAPPAVPSQAAAWIVVVSLAAILLLPLVTRRGIFLDGLVYATIARNMAIDRGDFWHPVYVGAIAQFRDHPPLAFWLESLAFRMCGDHWWVEKLYSVLAAVATGAVLVATWRWLVRGKSELQACGWIPLALWVTLPCWQWTLANNLLENTLSIFTGAAVYAALRASFSRRLWAPWIALAGGCILAAVLTKGPVGLFPLVAPAAAGICFRQAAGGERWLRRTLWQQLLLVGVVLLGIAWLLGHADSAEYLRLYWQQQVMASLKGQRETHPSIIGRAHILWEVFTNLLPGIVLAGVVNWWARRQRQAAAKLNGEPAAARRASRAARPGSVTAVPDMLRLGAWFCLLLGLAASCPVAISPKQTNFYVTPSYPFYVLAVALACGDSLAQLGRGIAPARLARTQRWLKIGAVAGVLASVAVCGLWWGTPRRDRREIDIARTVSQYVGTEVSIDVTPEVSREWALLGYLDRYHRIRLERDNAEREFRLELQGAGALPAGYAAVDVELPRYRLLRKTSGAAEAKLPRTPR